jgi:hypothetical protein
MQSGSRFTIRDLLWLMAFGGFVLGFLVQSYRAEQFRQWAVSATQRLQPLKDG